MVGLVRKLATPTCSGAPNRKEANELESAPYSESAGPLADIVTPGPKKAAPLDPNGFHIDSCQPSARMRRISTPHLTLCMELCQPQFHTQLKVLSTGFSGT